ncbi:CehA/McbA family metallohydrolase [Massilia sp. S19_KUP03_FR1]|uniref:CehA/McbA family metallohydrolase n=1 Tax=Massilia sp. S19_KUP03_FR1 TaxID=3025503 RepID=UPI002FCDB112
MKAPIVLLLFPLLACAAGPSPDHSEFEATLFAPYRAPPSGARTFTLSFDYPKLPTPLVATWRLDLSRAGVPVAQWHGQVTLHGAPVEAKVDWAGATQAGIYTVRLTAGVGGGDAVQEWEVAVGVPIAALAPAARAAALPWDIYLGNLHSQANDSDGGAALDSCHSAQPPQSAPFGPKDAYTFARGRGLDFLLTSEHNHMFDGSTGTNADADPETARARFHGGLAEAFRFTAAHPGFLALYGLEWGVIANGGHLNILDSTELLGWERGKDGAAIADTWTARSDYAGLYQLMRARGWTGQFNHPASTGQFVVNGVPLGYTRDGDAVMALCEVVNTNAFSSNDSETETRRSSFEAACNQALEAGYHVAFSSNQDNHCANWGAAYTNRTGVLLARGAPFNRATFMDAVRARRVFATMDKTGQLVLTANGHVMGERFTNNGALTLTAQFISSAGKQAASFKLMEGVPGRNGTVSVLSELASFTFTPVPGEHFYYARVTQDDGNILWSAPMWVTQM